MINEMIYDILCVRLLDAKSNLKTIFDFGNARYIPTITI